jgi:F-type H+-transporting ATPase subunit a
LKNRYLYLLILIFGLLAGTVQVTSAGISEEEAKPHGSEEEFDAATFIMEHVADSHEWHILTKKDGSSVAIYLPVIVYDRESGLHLFSSRKIAHGHSYNGFAMPMKVSMPGRS